MGRKNVALSERLGGAEKVAITEGLSVAEICCDCCGLGFAKNVALSEDLGEVEVCGAW